MTNDEQKSEVAKNEERVLEFWNKSNTFKKSEEKPAGRTGGDAPNGQFVFYDGPPFATGTPHFGHILAGTIKDAIPRYQTMNGKKVIRKWGWDCHGLPLENLIEKELGLDSKKEIEDFGIEKFNQTANQRVLCYAEDWEKIIPRMGRWVDMRKPYRTMDTTYTESVWWSFKEIYKKGLIYEGFKSMHYCPRCGTTLSNFEVNQGYKDIKDLSVVVKFELESEPNTFVLAWTTTPWTLPGNMALAINNKIVYSKIKNKSEKGKIFIVAKERLEEVFKDDEYEIVEDINGIDLIGKKYKPVFDYYSSSVASAKEDPNCNGREDVSKLTSGQWDNAWKIYGADFVDMEEGTGIVHMAPAFGSDDLKLAQKENIPVVHHVDEEGKFKKEIKDFAGMEVKPKENHQATDVEIIKYLTGKNLLFSKEKIEHSYPHCWRCETPLLNYATFSWFLETTKIKDKIIGENQKIKWVPENIRDGRFGKWLEGMVDWSVSRSRYWGAPLPVWKCKKCREVEVIGSLDDLKKKTKSGNNYYVMRHGEADNNVEKLCSSTNHEIHHLTEKGKKEVLESVQELKDKEIDLIISSPFARTKESVEILAKELDIENIEYEDRLGEINSGVWEGKHYNECGDLFYDLDRYFDEGPQKGESFSDVKKKIGGFLAEVDKKHSNKKILFVTHERPYWLMIAGAQYLNKEESLLWLKESKGVDNSEWSEFEYFELPHNENYELNLHRPYIDEVKFKCKCGGEMEIIREVFDCWYESGSMPYASKHYPFENLDIFNPEKGIGYPADFIAEGLDQTRGWFYSTLVLSVALFEKSAYQNVIVNGLVLAEDGQKMSKSKNNFPDPMDMVNKYGADALRYYMLVSPLMKAEDLSFSEKGVDEILKKIILRFKNVFSFYALYKDSKTADLNPNGSPNILDEWILVRLDDLIIQVSEKMDNYELDKATRPLLNFIDDLSTWYLRRSRDRFKMSVNSEDKSSYASSYVKTLEDKKAMEDRDFAITTTRFIIESLAKVCSPFMPFIAEDIWQKVTENNFKDENKSVHLENWPSFASSVAEAVEDKKATEDKPKASEVGKTLLEEMEEVRKIVSLGLEVRAKEGIKVRQPLKELKVQSLKSKRKEDLLDLIKDELNVKDVVFDKNIENEVELDLEITPELQEEGDFREFLRSVQIMRKNAGLQPQDKINLGIETDEIGQKLIEKFEDELKRIAGVDNIDFEEVIGEELEIGKYQFKVVIN